MRSKVDARNYYHGPTGKEYRELGGPFALHYAHLAPLRAFTNLELLTVLAAHRGCKITDAEYADLIPSWPHLGRIDIPANGSG